MTERIYRYEVAVDDEPHALELAGGDPLHVAATAGDRIVEFWATRSNAAPPQIRTFQVVGTGQPLPAGAQWRGTTARTPTGLVWHLVELPEASR